MSSEVSTVMGQPGSAAPVADAAPPSGVAFDFELRVVSARNNVLQASGSH
jgi:hypothetical protein